MFHVHCTKRVWCMTPLPSRRRSIIAIAKRWILTMNHHTAAGVRNLGGMMRILVHRGTLRIGWTSITMGCRRCRRGTTLSFVKCHLVWRFDHQLVMPHSLRGITLSPSKCHPGGTPRPFNWSHFCLRSPSSSLVLCFFFSFVSCRV